MWWKSTEVWSLYQTEPRLIYYAVSWWPLVWIWLMTRWTELLIIESTETYTWAHFRPVFVRGAHCQWLYAVVPRVERAPESKLPVHHGKVELTSCELFFFFSLSRIMICLTNELTGRIFIFFIGELGCIRRIWVKVGSSNCFSMFWCYYKHGF